LVSRNGPPLLTDEEAFMGTIALTEVRAELATSRARS
jgi:hypothetical protein